MAYACSACVWRHALDVQPRRRTRGSDDGVTSSLINRRNVYCSLGLGSRGGRVKARSDRFEICLFLCSSPFRYWSVMAHKHTPWRIAAGRKIRVGVSLTDAARGATTTDGATPKARTDGGKRTTEKPIQPETRGFPLVVPSACLFPLKPFALPPVCKHSRQLGNGDAAFSVRT